MKLKITVMSFRKDSMYRETLEMRDDSQSSEEPARKHYFLALWGRTDEF